MVDITKNLDTMLDIIKKYDTYSFLSSKFTHIDSVDRFVYDGKRYISRKSVLNSLQNNLTEFDENDIVKVDSIDPLIYPIIQNMTKVQLQDYLIQASKKIIAFLENKWNSVPYTPNLTYDDTFFIVEYLDGYVAITSENYKLEYKEKIKYIMDNFDSNKQVFADNQVDNYLVNDSDTLKYCDIDDLGTDGLANYLVIHKNNEKQFIKLESEIFNPNNITIFDEN